MDAQPAEETVETFNSLLRLGGGDVEALGQAAWRLRLLRRRNPADIWAGIGLMMAEQLVGRRAAAVAIGDELRGRQMAAVERTALATVETALGRYIEALGLVEHEASGPQRSPEVRKLLDSIFLATWDTGLHPALALPENEGFHAAGLRLEELGVLRHMKERQALVNRLIVPHQCGVATSATTDGGDSIILTRFVYTDLDRDGRRMLAEELAEAEDAFYASHGLDAGLLCYTLGEVPLPAQAQLPYLPALKLEQA